MTEPIDFEALLKEKFQHLRLADKQDVVAELASHLDQHYDDLVGDGMEAARATKVVLGEIGDPEALCSEIRRARGEDMLSNLRRVLLPGLLCVSVGSLSDWALLRVGCRPHLYWIRPNVFISVPPLTELIAFAFGGALAAMLAKRLRASHADQLLAAVVPMILLGTLLLLMGTSNVAWRILDHEGWTAVSLVLSMMGCFLLSHAAIPSLCSFAGAGVIVSATSSEQRAK